MMTELKHKVDNVLSNCDTSHGNEIENIFDGSRDVFNGLHTENLQKSFFKTNFDYVSFREVTVGTIMVKKKKGSKMLVVEKEEKFIYAPLLDSLKQFFSNRRIRNLILKPTRENQDGVFYQNHPFFNENPKALMLIIYHDKVEMCNPLGATATKHKLDLYYYSVANLDPKFRSKHYAVWLLAITNAKLVRKYGVNEILSSIIRDLEKLYEGFTFEIAQCT